MKLAKKSPAVLGFSQALAVAIYCLLVSSFISFMEGNVEKAPDILAGVIMLFLLVLSAAICGTLVFGYPVYLILQKNTKRALQVLAYTFLFAVIIFIVVLLLFVL